MHSNWPIKLIIVILYEEISEPRYGRKHTAVLISSCNWNYHQKQTWEEGKIYNTMLYHMVAFDISVQHLSYAEISASLARGNLPDLSKCPLNLFIITGRARYLQARRTRTQGYRQQHYCHWVFERYSGDQRAPSFRFFTKTVENIYTDSFPLESVKEP